MKALNPLTSEALDALHAHVALIDDAGVVIGVNKRWRRFGRSNGATSDYLGVNYLAVCGGTGAQGDRAASRAANGLRRLLDGEIDTFGLVYPCDQRVFRLRATRVSEQPATVLVAHEDITSIICARRERNHANADLSEMMTQHAAAIRTACEELGQRLAAITLAAHALQRNSTASAAVTTIQLATDEARHELRQLQRQVGARPRPRRPSRTEPSGSSSGRPDQGVGEPAGSAAS